MIPQQTFETFPVFSDTGTKVKPDDAKYSAGFQVNDVLPAEWMNWEWNKASKGVTDLNRGLDSVEKEINSVLASFGISPAEATNNQLLTALRLSSTFLTASSTTVAGPLLVTGGTIRVLFTAAIAGSDTATGLSISYNGTSIPVKVYKDGTLSAFTAAKISWEDASAVYRYLDAGTTLELLYDSTAFIIVNDPIVLKSIRHAIHADGTVEGGNIATIKPSFTDTLDYGWLACEHQSLLRADYPKLFDYFDTHYIGTQKMLEVFGSADSTHFYLPDTREAALVGAGRNSTDSIQHHDEYTIGQFKDDQILNHWHFARSQGSSGDNVSVPNYTTTKKSQTMFTDDTVARTVGPSYRYGDVNRGKRKGVKYIIKVL
jgi:microcystin-dependent protein